MKRIIRVVVSMAVLAVFLIPPASEANIVRAEGIPEAETVHLRATSTDVDQRLLNRVTDSAIYYGHYCYMGTDTHVSFTASRPFRSIYVMFEMPCRWTLTLPDGTVRQCGENEFLHEYIALDQDVTGFEADFPADSHLTEVYAFTDGQLPDWVQVWEPPCDRADLMLMPTHADDEHLWFGGAMPYYAGELGYKVQVVYLTNHYNATHRGHELLNGLWTVGVRNYPVITDKFLDDKKTKKSMEAAEQIFGRDRVLEFQVEMLRRFAPKVIIAHDINGEYGHGAHKLNASTLLEALKIYEDPSVYPESAEKYGITKVQKCYLHLWPDKQITVSWSDKKLSRFDGRSALEMAILGYRCHKSQLQWNNHVREWGKYDCRKFGLAYTTVGDDTPGLNDMFEHVDWSVPEPVESAPEEQPVTVSPSDPKAPAVSDSDLYMIFYGVKVLKTDILIALVALFFSLAGLVAVICLKRPK